MYIHTCTHTHTLTLAYTHNLPAPALQMLERALLCADVPVPYAHAWRDCYNQVRLWYCDPVWSHVEPHLANLLIIYTYIYICR